MKNKKAFTLIAAMFIMLAMALLAFTISAYISSDAVIAVKNYHSLDAFYIAGAGVEYYLKQLDGDYDWSTPPAPENKSFSGGLFTIATTDESRHRITVTVTGLVTVGAATYRRSIKSTVERTAGLGTLFDEFVLYMGTGPSDGSTIRNAATVTGSIFVEGDLDIGYSGNISGDVYATGTIEAGDNTYLGGTSESEAEPPYNPVDLDTTYYDNQITTAATYPAGDQSWAGSQTLSGPYYINGNVAFQTNCNISITGTATIVATGTVLVGDNAKIGDNFKVIAGGLITIRNNVILGKDGVWYSSVGIDMGNNADVGGGGDGEGTQFISPGDIHFGENCEYYGFIYAGGDFVQTGNNFYFEGNMIVGGDILVDNNVTLNINPNLVDPDEIIGVTVEGLETLETMEITEWDEAY